jgi:hypothetical protein
MFPPDAKGRTCESTNFIISPPDAGVGGFGCYEVGMLLFGGNRKEGGQKIASQWSCRCKFFSYTNFSADLKS